jgi:hypothetical protein
MRIANWSLWLSVGATLVACSKGGNGDGPDGGSASSAAGGKTDAGTATKPDAGHPTSSSSGSTTTATAASVVTMRNIGRNGGTLEFTVTGSDPSGQTTEAQVQLLDASGTPVIAFDTNWDGMPDSASKLLHFDASTLGEKTFTQTITLPGLYALAPTIASATVALSNEGGQLGPTLTADLTSQGVDALNAKCDPNEVTDRCAAGMSCQSGSSGSSSSSKSSSASSASKAAPTCHASVAPSLTQVAYYGGANPAQLFSGSDPDEDLADITISFLDATGKSLLVDLGDGNPVAQALLDAHGSATGTSFVFASYPATNFTALVPRISAIATDSLGNSGAPVTASLAAQPTHSNGGTCDPYGIIGCVAGSVCSPGLPSAMNTCGTVASLQVAKCSAAAATATTGKLAAWGVAGGVSLWDPPIGCAIATEVGRPESLVTLKLTQPVNQLTLSTAVPETDFDTILYVLPACASSTAQALGCNDDTQGYSSTVTLTNVAAGTYTIVVDSATLQGGHFGLTIATQ